MSAGTTELTAPAGHANGLIHCGLFYFALVGHRGENGPI
jgi:hypothetical protein